MAEDKPITLRDKILGEMAADYASALEKNFELAKQFIRITKTGKVDILFKEKLTGKEQIELYLIGKLYAKEAQLSSTEDAGSAELMSELGIRSVGSLFPWLKELGEAGVIESIKKGKFASYKIKINLVENVLKKIEEKVRKGGR
ncbi:MAG: hypothetical protein NT130_04585 [Candidatus Micrarchaeota archaeon]|nr:hypothetical protein [Candidatus Micrarchaeota archaeon]